MVIRTRSLFGWLIRLATGSPYDHALIAAAGQVVEAVPEGVRVVSGDEYAGCRAMANTAEPMTPEQEQAVLAKARSLAGEQYNWSAVAQIALADIGWHWRWLLRLARADRRLICSQMVVVAGQAAGLDWKCGKADPAQVTPADLAQRGGMEPASIS